MYKEVALIEELLEYFLDMEDPRVEDKIWYPMEELLLVGISSIICGGDSWQDMTDLGLSKLEFFREILPFARGIASPSTFERFYSSLDPRHFEECLAGWVEDMQSQKALEGVSIAIDGKTVRGSYDKKNGKTAIHLVSAYCRENGLILGQEKVGDKSNEITAIPKLLDLIAIKGSTVTVDAMGCQKAIAEKIIDQGGQYVLSLKSNHGNMHTAVKRFFSRHKKQGYTGMGYNFEHIEGVTSGHGRIEKRLVTVINQVGWLEDKELWANLSSLVMVESTVINGAKESNETRYFISSISAAKPEQMLELIRGHWSIESMHYVLDVTFKEDASRVRQKNADHNLAILRRITLNMLKSADISRKSIKSLRKRAGWQNSILKKILML
jgi:predicted transposase YbfD/YdcC